jgi:hypothetical protein
VTKPLNTAGRLRYPAEESKTASATGQSCHQAVAVSIPPALNATIQKYTHASPSLMHTINKTLMKRQWQTKIKTKSAEINLFSSTTMM